MECLLSADAALLSTIAKFMPLGDTFYTDAFAPVVDGVALPSDLISLLDKGHVAPGVPILAGSNRDEGTIFMGLTPRLRCRTATASALSDWANAFYGAELGAQIPHLYAAPRLPVRCATVSNERPPARWWMSPE